MKNAYTQIDTYGPPLWRGERRTLDAFGVFEARAEVHLDSSGRYMPVVRIWRGGVAWDTLAAEPLESEAAAIARAQWLAEALRPVVRPEDPVHGD